jgi:Domain of unknown function (DUF5122) beta-propeller
MRSRKRLLASIAVVMAGGMIAFSAPAAFALANTPDPQCYDIRGKVYSLTETSNHGTIYVGGKFSRASLLDGSKSYPASSLTRFDTATCAGDKTFVPIVTDATGTEPGIIYGMALTPDDSTLYIVGAFDLVNGQPRKDIAAIDTATGNVLPFTATPANQLDTVVLMTDGGGNVTKIIVGGSFNRMNNKPRNNLAALNPDGTLDTSWGAQVNSTVRDLKWAADGQSLFVSGGFTAATANGTNYPRQSIARINLDGSVNPWSVPLGVIPNPMTVWRMAPTPDVLYVGAGAGPNFAAAYALNHGDQGDQVWKRSTTGNVQGITLLPDGLNAVIGGHFGTNHKALKCGTHLLHGLAKISLATGKLNCTWTPHILPDSGNVTAAWVVLADSTYLWVGGNITAICEEDGVTGCVQTQAIARFTL